LGRFMATMLAELTERELRVAIATLRTLSEQSNNCRSFVLGAFEQLTRLVPSDLTTLSVCDLKRGTRRVFGRQQEALSAADRDAFDRHFHEHPLVRFHGTNPAGPTRRISDCVDIRAFQNSAIYAEYYSRIGIKHVMALPLRIDCDNVISIVFNRSRCDFKNAESGVLDVIRPPLAALYRNVVARQEAGVYLTRVSELAMCGGWQRMRVTAAGQILTAAAPALQLLARFFPREAIGRMSQLPATIADWISYSRNWGLDRPAMSHSGAFTMSRLGAKLTAHFVPDPADETAGWLLLKSELQDVSAAALTTFPLTKREREVLAFVASGKTNLDIAMLLAISVRTVQKHLEHVFQKLGVETRTAAAVRVMTALEPAALAPR
jgi:DNA-binding CsgD family transcriptional regulator